MDEGYKVSVTVEGPAYLDDNGYGPRERRDQLASFTVELSGATAWRIYQKALASAVGTDVIA